MSFLSSQKLFLSVFDHFFLFLAVSCNFLLFLAVSVITQVVSFFPVPGHFFLFLAVSVVSQAIFSFLAVSGVFWLFLAVSGRPQKAANGKIALSFQSSVYIFWPWCFGPGTELWTLRSGFHTADVEKSVFSELNRFFCSQRLILTKCS